MSNKRDSIKQDVFKKLYVHCGNQCAIEGCCNPIFEDDMTLTGECCHIEAYSPSGPRYNPNSNNKERNSAFNLVFLCSRHHTIIDAHPEIYTTNFLKQMKAKHEEKFSASSLQMTGTMIESLKIQSKRFWNLIENINIDNKCPDLKMEIHKDVSFEIILNNTHKGINNLIEIIEENISYKTDCFDFEISCLGAPNTCSKLMLDFLQLKVKILEYLITNGHYEYQHLLSQAQVELEIAHKKSFYND